MKILTVVGARPQFIKAAVVSRHIREKNVEILVHTGQHYDYNMSAIFFRELNIPSPDYNLNVGSGSHARQTGEMMWKIEEIVLKETPDFVLVYGDTNSTLAAALASVKIHCPIIHVESGLRSFNMRMPEEINRVLTDRVSSILFCPTSTAVSNLQREGITKNVFNVGDVMYDAILEYQSILSAKPSSFFLGSLVPLFDSARHLDAWYFATIHRAENTDQISKIGNILLALNSLPSPVVFPIHPRIKNLVLELLKTNHYPNIYFIEPVDYITSLFLTKNAIKVITDSGGLQKEAFLLGTPCVTVRDQTEWIETLNGNRNVLAKPNVPDIIDKVINAKVDDKIQPSYFGDGHASERIVEIIGKGVIL